jgi:hypothetical protein
VLLPDLLTNYRRLYVDVFSIAASLSWPEELFASAAKAGVNAAFVIDAWHEPHMPLARRYFDLCRRYGLDCRLSEQKPAEIYAVELCEAECGARCAVVTRDYDAVKTVSLYKTARSRAVEETAADITAAVATKRVSVSRGIGWLLIGYGTTPKAMQ